MTARQSVIKGYSPILTSCRILGEAAIADVDLQAFSWYARVPSPSNVADPASRLDFERLRRILPGAAQVEPVLPASWDSRPAKEMKFWFG
jgi:hypothetical protein